jgi:Domain of unknown function (DUF4158)/Tn3 transposase DDE domain
VPVEFLTDEEAARYGRYGERLSRLVLEKLFFLDDDDKVLIGRHRGPHMMLGFALQLVTVRFLGTFLNDPLDVPTEVVDYVAEQLGIADPSCVKRYIERRSTRFEHAEEIKRAYGLRDFALAEADLAAWVDARAWATGDGPKVIFTDAVAWLRERRVLLPGVTTLARLVARVREEANVRLWDTMAGLLTGPQGRLLDLLLEVPAGSRVSDLEWWRRTPLKGSGPGMIKALGRVAGITGLGLAAVDLDAAVPHRRVVELARYGMAAKAAQLRRHGDSRRLATLLATVSYLEAKAVDDALELFDLLMTTELVGRAERQAERERARRHPRLARAAAKVTAAVEVLLEADGWGENVTLADVWEAIEVVVPRAELAAAVSTITGLVPPPDADDDGDWRAELARRIVTVSGFVKILTEVIEFGCNADGAETLDAMRELPALLGRRRKLAVADIRAGLVTGSWQRLVFGGPPHRAGMVDKNAYVFCVLTEFHRRLRRGDIYAEASSRWRDPRAQLLAGPAWETTKGPVLTALSLPDDPGSLLAGQARLLDAAYREAVGRIAAGTDMSVDRDGRLHLAALKAIPEPPSLLDLRKWVEAMLPRVDLPEVILEVMSWEPGFTAAFTSITGGRARLEGLDISVAACLAAHAMNIGFAPVISPGVPALERDRLAHVDHTYLCAENYAAANAFLIQAQARIPLAAEWGAGTSPRWTGCGSSSRCRPSTPGPAASTSARAGRPARPPAVAVRSGRGLRAAEHRGPRPHRPSPDDPALAGHPAGSRLHLHRVGPCL